MKISIAGKSWRRLFVADIIKRLGIIAPIGQDIDSEIIVVCENLSESRVDELLDFSRSGKYVVFLQPESKIIKLFGNELMYTYHFPLIQLDCKEIPVNFLQVFPPVSLIKQKNGENIGLFALNFSRSGENYTTKYPAILWKDYGSGKIGIFLYDFVATMLLLLQGWEFFTSEGNLSRSLRTNIARAMHLADHLISENLASIPQAYFHELLLLILLRIMVRKKDPLPRIWYYPYPHTSALLLSGDSDGLEKNYLEKAWNLFWKKGLKYTQYIMVQDIEKFSAEEISGRADAGIEFGLHYYAGPSPTAEEMLKHMREAKDVFISRNTRINLCRGHSCIWVGWDENVRIMERAGISYSSNLLYWYPGVSYGFPYFLYTKTKKSKIQELQIFCSDDTMLFNKTGRPHHKPDTFMKSLISWLDIHNDLFYQPVNPIFHPFYLVKKPLTSDALDASINFAKNKDILIMNHGMFFNWWNRRLKSGLTYRVTDDSVEFYSAIENTNGIAVALPEKWKIKNLSEKKTLKGTAEQLFCLEDKINEEK